MPKNAIKTTGDLRRKLVEIMELVEAKKIDPGQARTMTNIAAQINNSFYAEAKTAIVHWQLQGQYYAVGDTPIEGAIEEDQDDDQPEEQPQLEPPVTPVAKTATAKKGK